jgi:NAD(P)-dependent dehydrogenase (short-subunit alcohol dehydrogenase family)
LLRNSKPAPGWFGSSFHPEDLTDADDILDRIKLFHIPLDLSSTSSIKNCAKTFLAKERSLDVLLLNAAVAPNARKMTEMRLQGEPVEEALMTNVLGHALLVQSLRSAFPDKQAEQATRIVTVSSELHRKLEPGGTWLLSICS